MSAPAIPPAHHTGTPVADAPGLSRFTKWHRRVWNVLLIVFALELGIFLTVFPWRMEWEMNWVAIHSRRWSDVWMSYYFRGAVSGLGLLNVYVAVSEFVRQVKAFVEKKR